MVHAQGTSIGISQAAVPDLDRQTTRRSLAPRGRLSRADDTYPFRNARDYAVPPRIAPDCYPSAMCLLVVAIDSHPRLPLIVAGNRDEFHARPTQEAHWWPDYPDIISSVAAIYRPVEPGWR